MYLSLAKFSGTPEQLIEAVKAADANLTSLDLSRNNLSQFSLESRIALFAAIPRTVTTLNLRGCRLGLCADEQLPPYPTELASISYHALNTAFQQLPPLTKLDLSENWFRVINGRWPELTFLFPAGLKVLDLSSNELFYHPAGSFLALANSLPASIDTLVLHCNSLLSKCPTEEILAVFDRLLPQLKVLDLAYNELSEKNPVEITVICQRAKKVPTTVVSFKGNFTERPSGFFVPSQAPGGKWAWQHHPHTM